MPSAVQKAAGDAGAVERVLEIPNVALHSFLARVVDRTGHHPVAWNRTHRRSAARHFGHRFRGQPHGAFEGGVLAIKVSEPIVVRRGGRRVTSRSSGQIRLVPAAVVDAARSTETDAHTPR
jgi:hypothetical protein